MGSQPMNLVSRPLFALGVLAALATPALAQSSASFQLAESVLNAGGRPSQGASVSSPSFHVTLDAIGDAALGSGLASSSFRMSGGFAAPHRPAGEVQGLTALADKQSFQWNWEPASTAFDVYRDPLSVLPTSFGACQAGRVGTNSWSDSGIPAAGVGWFYLVTGENPLGEEGTLGAESSGSERPNTAPCP
jgi:hypothetical protein